MASRTEPGTAARSGWWIGALAVATVIAAATLGQAPRPATVGPSAYLPADGSRVRFVNAGGSRSSEWAIDQALNLADLSGTAFGTWLLQSGRLADSGMGARLTTVVADPSGAATSREEDYLTIGASGVGTAAEVRTTTGSRLYFPARTDLSAAMAAGRSWHSEGTVWLLTNGTKTESPYRADYTARAVSDHDQVVRRCLDVTMRLTIAGVADPDLTKTWCPGLGVVAVTDAQGSWRATTDPLVRPVAPAAVLDSSRAEQLTFAPHTINDPQVRQSVILAAKSAPAVLTDGTVVASGLTQRDTLGLSFAVDPVRTAWRARAGGTNLATAVFSDITVVSGSQRQLVAYDSWGRWLWQIDLPDQAFVAPVRLGDQIVVATLDGSVSAYRLDSGRPVWTRQLSAEIRLPLVAAADRVVAIDQTGLMACFDPEGQQLWSRQFDQPSRFTIAGTSAMVVIADTPVRLLGITLGDGQEAWRRVAPVSNPEWIGLDTVVVMRDSTAVVGVDPGSGGERWRWSDEPTLLAAGIGDRLLLATNSGIVLLDDAGRLRRRWPMELAALNGSNGYLTAGPDAVLLWGPTGTQVGVVR